MSQFISTQPSSITVFDSRTKSLEGPENELEIIRNFPFDQYEIVFAQGFGEFFFIDPIPDYIKNCLKNFQIWERVIHGLIRHYSLPNSIAIDIGAHIGTHTLGMARSVGPKGIVYAFEPQMKIYRELVMNIRLNQYANVKAYRCALGASEGVTQMGPPLLGNEGGTSIGIGSDYCRLQRLDAFQLNNVSLIKIDVENFELEVLRGAVKTITRNRPIIIIEIFKIWQKEENKKFEQTIDLLATQLHYTLIQIDLNDFLAIPK